MARRHKDVEFLVAVAGTTVGRTRAFSEAATLAVIQSATGLSDVRIDVVIHSESGARAWGGDSAVEQYREDPEASAFERIEIKANNLGRVS